MYKRRKQRNRGRERPLNDSNLDVDLFDYERCLRLNRGQDDDHFFLEDSAFEIFKFPAKMLEFECAQIRLKLDGIPIELSNVSWDKSAECVQELKKILEEEVSKVNF